ncbi:MAG TPA: CHASE3 domain-containing protein [Terriglobales bacterium]|nr:CHASE3 domain-containing protein [Terriglobales bacterium]
MPDRKLSSRNQAQVAFASALILLSLSGLATYFTIVRLLESEEWVIHTYQVQAALGDIDSTAAMAGRARNGYEATTDANFLKSFDVAVREIPLKLQYLRDLTKDNPEQQRLCQDLEDLTRRRIALFQASVDLEKKAPQDLEGQAALSRSGVPLADQVTAAMQSMRSQEEGLLKSRTARSKRLLHLAIAILVITFILALVFFSIHYKLLRAELDARSQAEHTARDSEESLRRLTVRLLQLQDEERRKFSRELHDSLGQYLAGVKMNLEMLAGNRPSDGVLSEAVELLDQAIIETRTISHLLHPPLLDETGFSSATQWYVEGFAQRSGIQVSLDLPDNVGRLPKPVEIGLFRVLQESLTNVHRHSGSPKADVAVRLLPERVILTVRDYGKGIQPGLLENFSARKASSGVGLAGMRERVRDLGGQLEIQSNLPGTSIRATMPLTGRVASSDSSAA